MIFLNNDLEPKNWLANEFFEKWKWFQKIMGFKRISIVDQRGAWVVINWKRLILKKILPLCWSHSEKGALIELEFLIVWRRDLLRISTSNIWRWVERIVTELDILSRINLNKVVDSVSLLQMKKGAILLKKVVQSVICNLREKKMKFTFLRWDNFNALLKERFNESNKPPNKI